jgi:hypothetical protein
MKETNINKVIVIKNGSSYYAIRENDSVVLAKERSETLAKQAGEKRKDIL